VVQTQLHSVPPFAAAFALCIILAYLSDRTNLRLPYVLFSMVLIVIGLVILTTTHGNFSAQYGGIFLVCIGAFTAAPVIICWYLMNLQGHQARSIGSGWMISFGNTGGILAPFIFLSSSAPYYLPGYSICAAAAALGIVVTIIYAFLVVRERARIPKSYETETTPRLAL
jgi:MFS family permease